MSTQALTINFHGTDLFIIEQDGQPYTPMKTIVEGMGLGWQAQYDKLTSNAERWGIRKILIPTLGNMQEAVCLPLRKLSGWLATISPNKVKPELRDTILYYQNECDDVLWEYWTKRQPQYGLKQLPEPKTKKSLPGCLTLEQQDVIKQLVNGRAEDLPKDKKAAAVIKGWSAIKNKFGCTYKEISPDNFVNVISLITRLPIDGELLEKPEQLPSNTFTVDLNTPVGLQQITFKFLIEGYSSGRWLMYLDNGTFTIRPMKEDELCMSFDKWLNFANSERGYLVIKKSEVLDRLMHSNGGVK